MKFGILKLLAFGAFYLSFGNNGTPVEKNKNIIVENVCSAEHITTVNPLIFDDKSVSLAYQRINKFRIEKGLPELKVKGAMVYLAKTHSKNMSQAEELYNLPGNSTRGTFTIVASITAKASSEKDLIEIWKSSSYHNRILTQKYGENTYMGLGKVGNYYTLVIAKEG